MRAAHARDRGQILADPCAPRSHRAARTTSLVARPIRVESGSAPPRVRRQASAAGGSVCSSVRRRHEGWPDPWIGPKGAPTVVTEHRVPRATAPTREVVMLGAALPIRTSRHRAARGVAGSARTISPSDPDRCGGRCIAPPACARERCLRPRRRVAEATGRFVVDRVFGITHRAKNLLTLAGRRARRAGKVRAGGRTVKRFVTGGRCKRTSRRFDSRARPIAISPRAHRDRASPTRTGTRAAHPRRS